jgi:hypothetical protein
LPTGRSGFAKLRQAGNPRATGTAGVDRVALNRHGKHVAGNLLDNGATAQRELFVMKAAKLRDDSSSVDFRFERYHGGGFMM